MAYFYRREGGERGSKRREDGVNEGRVVRSSWRLWIRQWMRGEEGEEQGVELVSGQ